MLVRELMDEKKMTVYRFAQLSGVPRSTINDIYHGRAQLEKCNGETLYRIAKALDVTMETLIEDSMEKRIDFELFKSNVCHQLKELGDVDFVITVLESNRIRHYHRKRWYAESLYLLAMVDYVSRINSIPYCAEYNDLRKCKLSETLYPAGVCAAAEVSDDEEIKMKAYCEAIPEFIRFNIVESEVRHVV